MYTLGWLTAMYTRACCIHYHLWITSHSLKVLKLSAQLQAFWKTSTPLNTNFIVRKAVNRGISDNVVLLANYMTKATCWFVFLLGSNNYIYYQWLNDWLLKYTHMPLNNYRLLVYGISHSSTMQSQSPQQKWCPHHWGHFNEEWPTITYCAYHLTLRGPT